MCTLASLSLRSILSTAECV